MKIDIALAQNYSPREMEALGALADRHGIATLWASNAADTRDQIVSLAVMARATRNIHLGITAMSPFEMLPLRISNVLQSLNELSNGRASILVGGGGTIIGLIEKPARRVRAVQECIEILKAASAETPLSYKGEIYPIRFYHPHWAVTPAPKVLAAANRPQMLRMAARVADGIMLSDMPPVMLDGVLAAVRDALQAASRPEKGFELNNFWAFHVKPTKKEALAEARANLALRGMLKRHYLEPFLSPADCDLVTASMPAFFRAFRRQSPNVEGVPDAIMDRLAESLTLAAAVDDLEPRIAQLKEFEAAGLTHLTLGVHGDPAAAIEIVGERIIPALS